ncbi:MAG: MTAP family purine nucleoside phosphorylase [Gemmatimonadetes bacterium]|nr:MTAP family purine nucleoside phosphorylase [Gemmatimonadota bacterium]
MTEPRTEVLPKALSIPYDERFSEVAFITGGKVYRLARERLGTVVDVLVKETPFGCSTPVLFMKHGERRFYVLPRHGEREYRVTAPFVNYRANVWALKELGVRRIVAWSGPGALSTDFRIGEFVLPADLLDFTKGRASTYFEDKGFGILRQSPPFCSTLENALGQVMDEMALTPRRDAVYAVNEGPRLETPAEVRMLRVLGADLVGMTLAPEAFLARELEICYHPVAYVTNYAEGVAEIDEERREVWIDEALELLPEITWNFLELLPTTTPACSCEDSMLRYKRRGLIPDDFREWI